MKQMRSRFRLITLLMTFALLLALVICAGRILKAAGITLDTASVFQAVNGTTTPDLSSASPALETTPAPPDSSPDGSSFPETDISPDPEYNVFGL